MQRPQISVLMPVYNAASYLREAVESILGQDFKDFELICVNDGSTDDSGKILASYTDPRLRVITQLQNQGIVNTLNNGLAECRGEYIARMDSDDIAMHERFSKQLEAFQSDPNIAVVDTVQTLMDENGHPLGKTNSRVVKAKDIYNTLPKSNCLGHPSVMVRGDLLRQYGYRKVAYEDYDLWLRMAADGLKILKLEQALLRFREHGKSITGVDHAGARHFQKVVQTKVFYLSGLTFTARFKGFNMRVAAWLLRDLAIHSYKRLKLATAAKRPA